MAVRSVSAHVLKHGTSFRNGYWVRTPGIPQCEAQLNAHHLTLAIENSYERTVIVGCVLQE